MINDIQNDAQNRMAKSVEALRHTLVKVRTGRASTALTICFSYGVMVSERASDTATPATCDSGTSEP